MEPHEVAPLVEAAEEVRVQEERALAERIAARVAAEAVAPGWEEGYATDARIYKTLEEEGGGLRTRDLEARVQRLQASVGDRLAETECEEEAAAARMEAGETVGRKLSSIAADLKAKRGRWRRWSPAASSSCTRRPPSPRRSCSRSR